MRALAAVPNVHDIPVLDPVFLAFQAECSLRAGGGFGACAQQCVPMDGFGADEVLFEIGMNGPGGVLGAGIYWDGPGTALIFAYGKKGDQAEQFVALADETARPLSPNP